MSDTNITEKKIGSGVNQTPVVSVLIPAFNAADFIAETLDSVLSQTYKNYEIILVNDGSPDTAEFEKVLENYFEKIIYIKQENGGTAAARNTAIKNSSGELLAFLDGDDIWFAAYLESQINELNAKNCDLIYCNALLFGSVHDPHETFMTKSPSRGAVTAESLISGKCNIITSGTLAHREKIVEAGMFDESLPCIGMEDFDLWFQLAKSGAKLDYQKEILLKYRVRPNSLSGSNVQRAERGVTALKIISQKFELNKREKTIIEQRRKKLIARLEIEKGKFNLTQGKYEAANDNLIAANQQTRKLKLIFLSRLLRISPQFVSWLFQKFRRSEFAFILPLEKTNSTTETVSESNSLMKQSAWLMFAKVIGFILSALFPLLTVRYLTQDKVGLYRQAFQIITNAVTILPLGFSMSAFYFLNRQPENRGATIANILLFNFIIGGLAFLTLFFYPQILGKIFVSADMTRLAPLIGVVIWLWIFSMFLEVVALANKETGLATAFIISTQLTKTILMTSAVILLTTVEAFLYAAMIQAVLQIIVLLIYLNSRFPRFWKDFNAKFFREQMVYALPFGLAGLLYTSQTDIHNYFVGHKFSEADFAIYAIGCFELPLMGMLYESFSAVLIPRMSELESQNNKREMFLTAVSAMQRLAFAYFPVFIFLMIVADVFITTLFTKTYAESVPIFRVNLLLLPFYCLMIDPIGRAFPAIGKFLLKIRIVIFFALLAALYFGIQHFDLRGMISIVVVALVIEKTISTIKIISLLEVTRKDFELLKSVGKTAIAAGLAGIMLSVFYWFAKDSVLEFCLNFSHSTLNLIGFGKGADFVGGSIFLGVCLAIFAGVYLFASNYLGVISAEDKSKIIEFLRKIRGRPARKDLDLQFEIPD